MTNEQVPEGPLATALSNALEVYDRERKARNLREKDEAEIQRGKAFAARALRLGIKPDTLFLMDAMDDIKAAIYATVPDR